MMKYIIIILYLIIYTASIEINNNEEIIPEEINHGIIQNGSWEKGKYYEYYINISNYELNEENILEIYGIGEELSIDINILNIYFLFSDINDVELIKNGSVKPNIEKDIYHLDLFNKKFDHLTKEFYLFLPFKKSSSSYN